MVTPQTNTKGKVPQKAAQPKKAAPVQTFRVGQITASVWVNEQESNGQTFKIPSVTIRKSYTDQQTGEWKEASSFKGADLPKLQIVLEKAYEYCVTRAYETKDEQADTSSDDVI